jgi:hypothetical protein
MSGQYWWSVASSSDGSQLVAGVYGGDIFTASSSALASQGTSSSASSTASGVKAPATGYGAPVTISPLTKILVIGSLVSVGAGLLIIYRSKHATTKS